MNDSRERDDSVDRWLRRASRTRSETAATDACLDAETMAAWVDGGLAGDALETTEAHVASCARCQAMAGTLVRLEVPGFRGHASKRRWLSWVVPLTAAAAVVTLLLVIPRDAGRRAAQVAPAAPPPQAAPAPPPQAADKRLKEEPPARGDQRRALRDENVRANEGRNKAAQERTREELADQRNAAKADTAANRRGSVANAPPPAAAAQQAAPTELLGRSARVDARAAFAAVLEIRSSDPAVRWRVTAGGVERSTDAGSTWQPVPTGIAAEITAGASPSSSICWLAGRGGVVLLSADGRTWRRLPFPEATDLSGIRATDARTATVTTADGRELTTIDAGETWIRR